MNKIKPKRQPYGKLKLIKAVQKGTINNITCPITVFVEDEKGDRWTYFASCFSFDMELIKNQKESN